MSSEVSAHKAKNNHNFEVKINISSTVINMFYLNVTQIILFM